MPLVEPSGYRSPAWLRNGHAQTIFPALFRRLPLVTRRRERLELSDGDFLDLDWNTDRRADRVAILTHGLEGTSANAYVQGMAAALVRAGWDVLAWNLRGCSGEPNRLLRSYHSGVSDDLKCVVEHALATGRYRRAALVGFSIGGNLTLKYLGESPPDSRVDRAVVFSVPCDLGASSRKLESRSNRLYMQRFLETLAKKIREKIQRFPGQLRDQGLRDMRTFAEFDEAYTAPLHGFANAQDYWQRASSQPVLPNIQTRTLLVSALDDPFLSAECFPHEAAHANPHFFLETPERGGHLGFVSFRRPNEYWSETRAVEFLE